MKRLLVYGCALVWGLATISCKSDSTPAPSPYKVVPSQKQVDWQNMEYYMFAHFGPNTFTDKEWGDGTENPEVFNPTNLDCRQWAATAKKAGMKGIIITAKHHDGFCLWPSKYSNHTVAQSKWRDGKGDVLKELSEACKEYGLKMGVYLSPWDQNHPAYGTPEYNQVFANMLTEVLTNYGEIFEVWFDGACGEEDAHRQPYDWELFNSTINKLQPNAVIFSDVGPDCRWMGNERGFIGNTNWSYITVDGHTPGNGAPAADTLNSGMMYGKSWIPAEADVSIRPGWFYSAKDDGKVKDFRELMNIWYSSVGRNGNLLLNVPPDRTGRINAIDSTSLFQFRALRELVFENNLAAKATITASTVRGNSKKFAASKINDGKDDTYWASDDMYGKADITIDFGKPVKFNNIMIQEYIPLGQRIKSLTIYTWNDSMERWEPLRNLTTIGHKRLLRFTAVESSKIKLAINNSLACPTISNVEVYNAMEW